MRTRRMRVSLSAMASRALCSRLRITCSMRMASPSTSASSSICVRSSTCSLRIRGANSCRACSSTSPRHRRSLRPAGVLRAKVLRWPVSAAMRCSRPSMRCRPSRTASGRPLSSSRRRLPSCICRAVSGWLISCASAADICPSAAILAACTRPSWAWRSSAVRSATSRSRRSRMPACKRWFLRRWARNNSRKAKVIHTPAAARR